MKGKKVAVDAVGSTHRHKRQKAKKKKSSNNNSKGGGGCAQTPNSLRRLIPTAAVSDRLKKEHSSHFCFFLSFSVVYLLYSSSVGAFSCFVCYGPELLRALDLMRGAINFYASSTSLSLFSLAIRVLVLPLELLRNFHRSAGRLGAVQRLGVTQVS